jgi:hypothetical protein
MNSSASRLGLTDALLRDELFPSLNDPETINGVGCIAVGVDSEAERPLLVSGVAVAGATAPPSSETSAIADLADSVSHIQMQLDSVRIQNLGFQIRYIYLLYIYKNDTDIQVYGYRHKHTERKCGFENGSLRERKKKD